MTTWDDAMGMRSELISEQEKALMAIRISHNVLLGLLVFYFVVMTFALFCLVVR